MRGLFAEILVALLASVVVAVRVAAGGTALARVPSIAEMSEATRADRLVMCAVAPGDIGCVPEDQ